MIFVVLNPSSFHLGGSLAPALLKVLDVLSEVRHDDDPLGGNEITKKTKSPIHSLHRPAAGNPPLPGGTIRCHSDGFPSVPRTQYGPLPNRKKPLPCQKNGSGSELNPFGFHLNRRPRCYLRKPCCFPYFFFVEGSF